jgi:hypothetical protein
LGRGRRRPLPHAWQDDEQGKVETRITEIAIQIILTAELQCREGTMRSHEWRVQGKAELELGVSSRMACLEVSIYSSWTLIDVPTSGQHPYLPALRPDGSHQSLTSILSS